MRNTVHTQFPESTWQQNNNEINVRICQQQEQTKHKHSFIPQLLQMQKVMNQNDTEAPVPGSVTMWMLAGTR